MARKRRRPTTLADAVGAAVGAGARGERRPRPQRRPQRPRRRPPVIGLRGAGEVRLAPRLKQRLRRQTRRQVRKKFAPVMDLYRQQLEQAQAQKRQAVSRANAGVDIVADATDVSRSDLRQEGLRGKALSDVEQEFAARNQDVEQARGFLTQDVRSEYGGAVADARTNLLNTRIDKQQAFQESYGSALNEVRVDAEAEQRRRMAAERTRRKERRGERGGEEPDEGLRNAVLAAKSALDVWKRNEALPPDFEDPALAGKTPQDIFPLRSPEDLRSFAISLTKDYEGVNISDAMKALRAILRRQGIGAQAGPPAPGTIRPGPFGG